jgi:anti-anti-sigma factor
MKTDGYLNKEGGEKILNEFIKNSNNGISVVILDLDKSKIVNSIGVSYLIDIVERLMDTEGKLVFTNLDPAVKNTLDMMGIFQVAEIAESVESALKYAGK